MRLSKFNQTGSALIISLILLMLLTMLGLSGAQVSSLEEKMAGNQRNSNLAFQAAEIALRTGEFDVRDRAANELDASKINCTNGLYPAGDLDCNGIDPEPIWNNDNMTWSDAQAIPYNGTGLPTILASKPPAYIVEQLAGVPTGPEVPAVMESSYYRITARGVGGSDSAVAIVQSIFKR